MPAAARFLRAVIRLHIVWSAGMIASVVGLTGLSGGLANGAVVAFLLLGVVELGLGAILVVPLNVAFSFLLMRALARSRVLTVTVVLCSGLVWFGLAWMVWAFSGEAGRLSAALWLTVGGIVYDVVFIKWGPGESSLRAMASRG